MNSAQRQKVMDATTALRPWLKDGMTIGLGGFGLDRKPMRLIAEIAQSGVKDLVLETFAGGLDIDMLIAQGQVAKVSACHVGLDHFGLAPLFRAARQSGQVAFEEWSELTQLAAWRAASDQAPYMVVPFDTHSELLRVNPNIRKAPAIWGETDGMVAVKAPVIDLAILHVEAAHPQGWATALGDPYLDQLLARAAKRVVISAERLMDDAELEARHRDVHLLGATVDAVVLAPKGAAPGSCLPDYMLDFNRMRSYVEAAADDVDALKAIVFGPLATGETAPLAREGLPA